MRTKQMQMIQLRVPQKIKTNFIISITLLAITFGLTLYSLNRLITKADWVEHTNQVLFDLENILSLLKDAEVGQRGYLLTEDPEFLEPYIGSYYRTIQKYKEVRNLTVDNHGQQKRLDTLNSLIVSRFNLLNQSIEFERSGELASAKAIVMTKKGKLLMDKIRALVKRMQNEELRLKEIRYDQVKTTSFYTPVLILFATFLSLLICIFAYRNTKNEIKERAHLNNELEQSNLELHNINEELKKAELHLKNLNSTLEIRVEERTSFLQQAKEELKNVNQELFKKNEILTRINTDLDNFIYAASHDLKAPITNIEGLVNLIKDSACYQEEETQELIDRISLSGEKLKMAIEDLAVVIHIQNDLELNGELVDVEKTVQDVCISISDLLLVSKAQIKVKVEPNAAIYFSPKNFRSILFNLMHNAIKYRAYDRPPEIEISVEQVPDATLLSIKDNGLGFNPAKKDNIFILFKRLHNHVEGSGVGLFIVKRMMDNAGGRVEVESEVNAGTTFRLYFPA